jgi:proteasome lid subunit RPN8/RPN11
MAELARRTKGETQESGAFLLGREIASGQHRIVDFVFYDDIDANALASGVVVIRQTALPRLWAICRERGYGVVADIHVHPAGCWQSDSDQANPVMPRAGHIAMILPNFARGNPEPGAIGIYEFLGGRNWRDHSASGSRFVKLEAL